MARHSANDSENDSVGADTAPLLAQIRALEQRLAALEARQRENASADPSERRQATRQPRPPSKTDAAAREVIAAGAIARRRALGVGALASLFAFVGRSAARAADALTGDALSIDSGGVARFNGTRNLFTDQEKAGNLRVGAAWGVPGIYSEKGAVTVGAESGVIWLRGKVGISGAASDAKKAPSQSLDVAGTVAADNLVAGSLTAGGIQINGKGQLAFGIGNQKNDAASGTIGYQVHTADALDIVGAGDGGKARKIKFWAEGGATFSGDVQIGAAFAARAAQPLRMVCGVVAPDGKMLSGTEFSVRIADTGLYEIQFNPPFASVPAASATQIFPNVNPKAGPTDERGSSSQSDFANIAYLSPDRMRVKTTVPGNFANRAFSFIAIGPRSRGPSRRQGRRVEAQTGDVWVLFASLGRRTGAHQFRKRPTTEAIANAI